MTEIEKTKAAMGLLIGQPIAVRLRGERREEMGILRDLGVTAFLWKTDEASYFDDVVSVRAVSWEDWNDLQDAGRYCAADAEIYA